ncbi:hypothetical protein FQN57_003081, partial [Myotisia sp. PD_48]
MPSDKAFIKKPNDTQSPQASHHDERNGTYQFSYSEHIPPKYLGTASDHIDMSQMGKEQVLRVGLSLLALGLTNGGTAGLFWGFISVSAGFALVFASIAEMASMAPTAGGQYHWVSEFAPRSCQKYLSYITGWLCTTGWQCAIVTIAYLAGTTIQGLIILNNSSYSPQMWHGTMLIIAISTFSIIFNTFLAKKLPVVEALLLILHVVGLCAIIVPLWVLSPRNNARYVFTEFTNKGGWNGIGTSVLVGLPTVIASMIGFDCAVHMSEEIKDASMTLPNAIMSSVAVNFVLGLVIFTTVCFTIGDVESILKTRTGIPFIQIFYNTTENHAATNAMATLVILALVASTITEVATASRQIWSFARDRGLPFSKTLSKVTPGWNIPLNSVLISLVVTVLLSLINIGSTAALNAITSLTITSLMSAYLISIGCLLYKRIVGEPLPPRRWSLGRWGGAINAAAMLFLIPIFIFAFFPASKVVTPVTMNWSIVIYLGIICFATGYYFAVGKFNYVPPIVL